MSNSENESTRSFLISDRRKGWFDPKITMGNLLTILGLIFTILIAWGQMSQNYEILKVKFELYQKQMDEKQVEIKNKLEKIDAGLNEVDKKVDKVIPRR